MDMLFSEVRLTDIRGEPDAMYTDMDMLFSPAIEKLNVY